MDADKTLYDLTSADTKIIGFDFQYFYFIYKLLDLREGQTIGYEVKDDIHIEIDDSSIIFFQLKHTTQKNINGVPNNLADLDKDLWKTISHWTDIISDEHNNRSSEYEQIKFLEKTQFILATNKKVSKNNFISKVNRFKDGKLEILDIKKWIEDKLKSVKSVETKCYLEKIISLSINVLSLFFKQIEFIDTGDNIINSIQKTLRRMMIVESRINDVFSSLLFELKKDFFEKVLNGKHQIITYDEWHNRYIKIFQNYRTNKLLIRPLPKKSLCNPIEQPFIKELIEIGEIKKDDFAEIAALSSHMLRLEMNLNRWHDDGELVSDDIRIFHNNNKLIWKNIHKKSHRKTIDKNTDTNNALICLDEIRGKELRIEETLLPIDLSNGEFYHLSNIKSIGWRKDWEDKY